MSDKKPESPSELALRLARQGVVLDLNRYGVLIDADGSTVIRVTDSKSRAEVAKALGCAYATPRAVHSALRALALEAQGDE